jgi:Spherulation-specific family 4
MATQPTGLLIPLYVYPANIHTNSDFNRVMDLKRRFRSIPFWVIVNPASGPGDSVDANYSKAIDRLVGAGCTVLGYVTTDYARQDEAEVIQHVKRWRELYPRVQGIFFDEMVYEDNERFSQYQARLNVNAQQLGFWPTVANPGTDTPERYFKSTAADVVVIHEGNQWPTEKKLHGDYFGGYSDYPSHTRAVLVYGQKTLDPEQVRLAAKYAGLIYVTDDRFDPKNPNEPNPWDTVPNYLEELCEMLTRIAAQQK